jgi:2-oxoglutarate dehydrogenase complex dehydrogenase (E1) component-like enzyme
MTERDEEREERIEMRIIVDAYTVEEQACAPLKEGETVRVVGMSSTEPTLSQQHVTVGWMDRELGVPLEQLEPVDASDTTEQAIADWHYWLER